MPVSSSIGIGAKIERGSFGFRRATTSIDFAVPGERMCLSHRRKVACSPTDSRSQTAASRSALMVSEGLLIGSRLVGSQYGWQGQTFVEQGT